MDSHAEEDLRSVLLNEYQRISGAAVENIEFFEVYACLKRLGSVLLSVTHGPEILGMQPEAASMMADQMRSIHRVYALLQSRTGLQTPEIEEMFARYR